MVDPVHEARRLLRRPGASFFITGFGIPLEMGADEIRSFLSHLAVNEHVSASTQNQALCACSCRGPVCA